MRQTCNAAESRAAIEHCARVISKNRSICDVADMPKGCIHH